MIRSAAFCIMVCMTAFSASAAEMLSIKVDHEDGRYLMNSEVWFDAPLESVFEVFSKWDYAVDFSSAIVDSKDVEPDEQGRPQFYVQNKGCVLFFCKSFVRRGYVELEANLFLLAFTDPENSDFHLSDERWDFETRDGGTVVTYDLTMQPKFWIPPAIGPYLIKRKLRNDGGNAIDRIEVIARGLSSD